MSRILYLSSRSPMDASQWDGAEALAENVVGIWPYQDIRIEGVDANARDREHPKIKLFLADMDSTMIGQECIDELADFAGVKAEVAAITERAMQGELNFEEALRARVALLAGLDEAVLQQCFEERITINEGAKPLMDALGAAGVRRVLVSGGFTFFAARIAAALGFDQYHANVLAVQDGRLTGKIEGDIVGAGRKAEVLMAQAAALGIDPQESAAIGDGANDLPMIEAAGIGIAYRAKPILREKAEMRLDHSPLDVLRHILPY